MYWGYSMKQEFINQYDIIIFDCDGVILDVNLLKSEAFGKVVEGYSEDIRNSFVEYCKKTFGISRYVKFKDFFSKFANEQFDEEKYLKFLSDYSDLCKEIYKYADITPGCLNLLSNLNALNKKVYVASGSDEKELNEVFIHRGLDKYFNGIYGSPKSKSECVIQILKENEKGNTILIGDALSDLNTTKEHKIDFIYMSKYTVQTVEQDRICRNDAKLVISSLEELSSNN